MSQPEWYCLCGDEERGPFSVQELKGMAKNGEIQADTLVRKGNRAWQWAEQIGFLVRFSKSCRRDEARSREDAQLLLLDISHVQDERPKVNLTREELSATIPYTQKVPRQRINWMNRARDKLLTPFGMLTLFFFGLYIMWVIMCQWRTGSAGMEKDPFASHTFSLVLSGGIFLALPGIVYGGILALYSPQKGTHWLFSTWVLFCLLVFSPLIYIVFQTSLVLSFPFQSISAFTASIWLAFCIPLILAVLFMLGVYLPYFVSFQLLGTKRPIRRFRYLLASIMTPIVILLGTLLFFIMLPLAAMSVHGLDPDEIIKATNGPAEYVGAISPWLPQPNYASKTPGTVRDAARCHVANTYLSESSQDSFIKRAYPNLYEELHEQHPNPEARDSTTSE